MTGLVGWHAAAAERTLREAASSPLMPAHLRRNVRLARRLARQLVGEIATDLDGARVPSTACCWIAPDQVAGPADLAVVEVLVGRWLERSLRRCDLPVVGTVVSVRLADDGDVPRWDLGPPAADPLAASTARTRAVLEPDGRPDQRILLDGPTVLGRAGEHFDGVLALGVVSARHAEVFPAAGRWAVRDLGSRNGTTLDGRELDDRPARLPHRATLRLAGTVPVHFIEDP